MKIPYIFFELKAMKGKLGKEEYVRFQQVINPKTMKIDGQFCQQIQDSHLIEDDIDLGNGKTQSSRPKKKKKKMLDLKSIIPFQKILDKKKTA